MQRLLPSLYFTLCFGTHVLEVCGLFNKKYSRPLATKLIASWLLGAAVFFRVHAFKCKARSADFLVVFRKYLVEFRDFLDLFCGDCSAFGWPQRLHSPEFSES